MKPVLIDITSLANEFRKKRQPHGIPRVTLAYLRYYHDHLQLIFRLGSRVFILPKEISKEIALLLVQWDQRTLKKLIKLIVKGVFFSFKSLPVDDCFVIKIDHGGMKNKSYVQSLRNKNLKILSLVHDLIPIEYPEYCTVQHTVKFAQSLESILKYSSGIVCVSEATQDVLENHVMETNKKCPPVISATLAPGLLPQLNPEGKRLIDGPYFVTVSTIGARKNHLLLLQIWRSLVDRLGEKTPKLIIVGRRSMDCWYTNALLDRSKKLKSVVIQTQATDRELANYLHHARALLYPTFTEGYGLPLIEALAVNLPIIASQLPVFHEIVGDIPDYFDPLDAIGWRNCIEQYSHEDSPQRQAQLTRMASFKMPTWDEHFAKVDSFIKKLESSN